MQFKLCKTITTNPDYYILQSYPSKLMEKYKENLGATDTEGIYKHHTSSTEDT